MPIVQESTLTALKTITEGGPTATNLTNAGVHTIGTGSMNGTIFTRNTGLGALTNDGKVITRYSMQGSNQSGSYYYPSGSTW